MKRYLFALLLLVGCSKAAPGLSPGQAGPVTIYDPQGLYTAQVNDAGQLSTTATLSGTVTVGTVGQGAAGASPWLVTNSPGQYVTASPQLATVSGAVKASAGTLYALTCTNRNAASRYLQVFNQTTGPSNATQSYYEWLEPAGGMIVIGDDFFSEGGWAFSTGIAFGNSTSSGTYTAATAGDHDCAFSYK